ncbi:glycosyltransferase [Methylovulum psychrotolerans]|uniref:Uncharacterized protein n=1 Tax=Methylovulum psychrotolerans TaxID=1704499 RepID=A0A1Z4C1Y3_9GAMM|nr:glycosyltransferase [Methylovulum psychrotolerans]ASF47529.1 hypothetical protein CEK71_16475 [Methylovulum psychrotolerans]
MELAPAPKPTVFLIEECANPSTDFFILPLLAAGGFPLVRCFHADVPEPEALTDAIVIFVRYVPPAWARLVGACRARLRALVFFMDDDVLDVAASAGMPLSYRYKLAKLAWRQRAWLRGQQPQLWVSTPYLVEKYATWRAQLVLPTPIAFPEPIRRIFYHGSIATHQAEIRWLRPVVAEVLARDPQAAFEIIGKKDVFELYRGLPRVTVVHTLKWPAYQGFLAQPGRHVGLNPLLDVPFNLARSQTKFLDITRCGAVGVYSPGGSCAAVVEHGRQGLVVANEQAAWVEAILSLTQDETFRYGLWGNAQAKTLEMAAQAQQANRQLLGG